MYTIEFYEDSRGNSSVWQFLETLRIKALTNKDARIQANMLMLKLIGRERYLFTRNYYKIYC